jgi:uncharacterized protein YbjT (DUF2867 family)
VSAVLVTGATGRTGRHVVAGLLERGATVRALVRDPRTAALPREVELVEGAFADLDAVRRAAAGVDAVFLLWPYVDDADPAEVVAALTAGRPHVTYLSAASADSEGPMEGIYAELEALVSAADPTATYVRPGGFMANSLEWAEAVRTGDTVRMPYPEAGRASIHEHDIADVAVRALLDQDLRGRGIAVTGPELLTMREQVETIGRVLGRELVVEEQPLEEARAAYAGQLGAEFTEQALGYWASLVERPEGVRDGVRRVTGRPGRTYAEWVRDHAAEFR